MSRVLRIWRWFFVISVRWRKVPAGPVKVPTWIFSSSRRISGQVRPTAFLGDAGQQESEPAEQDVGPDPVLGPGEDRAQVDDLLHVPPAALPFGRSRREEAPCGRE